jgi:hypothetical protein
MEDLTQRKRHVAYLISGNSPHVKDAFPRLLYYAAVELETRYFFVE